MAWRNTVPSAGWQPLFEDWKAWFFFPGLVAKGRMHTACQWSAASAWVLITWSCQDNSYIFGAELASN